MVMYLPEGILWVESVSSLSPSATTIPTVNLVLSTALQKYVDSTSKTETPSLICPPRARNRFEMNERFPDLPLSKQKKKKHNKKRNGYNS